MINPLEFAKFLDENIGIFAGVPDSLLKPLNSSLDQIINKDRFFTTANEGQAVAFACGYHLATSKIGLVYMQNSGLGNAINPLLSLADEKVYKIPLLLLIGLRGGDDDEPQHKKQGLVTDKILTACDIPFVTLSKNIEEAKVQFLNALSVCRDKFSPFAILIEKNTFEKSQTIDKKNQYELNREEAISLVQDTFLNAKFISTTGMISRENYELRELKNQGHENDFLVVGSMGFASSIAFMIDKFSDNKDKVVCLDGDGSFIMHMGSILNFKGSKFIHVVLNNFAHDSVGGQETNAKNCNFASIAKSCGYDECYSVSLKSELTTVLDRIKNSQKLIFLEIKVSKGARKNLGRPKDILKLKEKFCKGL
ncbi:phosphonopyruvate decarboxylase, putative [Campylobacter iguaniorum]|uniref:phosphonopyruvate decarboxylase n=1 Tax=Campylobacter iguaniorum TaxID=1244531 RepID=UPI00073A4049|nr:phosphonopyruvate decarboxylase [Campylobacter iguaniorum]ALV25251.1 phosphonopyruvate decarboxylase, putative [Campylobacter iguaniorum]ANE36443.1 phosphonopyruvate decarboxylase, putative [Campylobacter iguaniorum]